MLDLIYFVEKMNSQASLVSNNKFKNYLIDKLLNEQKQETIQFNDPLCIPMAKSSISNKVFENEIKSNAHYLTESKEDLQSETGTYTIEDLEENNKTDFETNLLGDNEKNVFESRDFNNLRQSTASTNIDLVSARAAIDETFGIVKHAKINEVKMYNQLLEKNNINIENSFQKSSEEQQNVKKSRARNKTYSLTKDLIRKNNENEFTKKLQKNDFFLNKL